MAKEYKTLVFQDTMQGRKQMAAEIDRLSAEGWEVKSKEVTQQGWSATKTCLLGCLFLPLALLGKKDNVITVIMERERLAGKLEGAKGNAAAAFTHEKPRRVGGAEALKGVGLVS